MPPPPPSESALAPTGFRTRERTGSNPMSHLGRGAPARSPASTTRRTYAPSSAGTARSARTATTDDAASDADGLLLLGGGGSGSRRGARGNARVPGLGGRGESDGEFDEGWTTGLEAEEEEIGLLQGGKAKVRSASAALSLLPVTTLTLGGCAEHADAGTRRPGRGQEDQGIVGAAALLLHVDSALDPAAHDPAQRARPQAQKVALPAQRGQEPEVQRGDVPPPRPVRAVQVLLQPVLSPRRAVAVCARTPHRCAFYPLGLLPLPARQCNPLTPDRAHPLAGFLATYIVPLAFVLLVTIGKEAFDDYTRYLRDRSANSALYSRLVPSSSTSTPHSHHASSSSSVSSAPLKPTPSSTLRVGDLVHLDKNDRVPADMVLLRTSDPSGTCFVRTDQLDGETDWKLRVAVERTQSLVGGDAAVVECEGEVYADPPSKDIHSFVGTLTLRSVPARRGATGGGGEGAERDGGGGGGAEEDEDLVASHAVEPLTAENMLWANTVLAAGAAVGMVVYTGRETRAVMNTSQPGTKVGLLDHEINRLAKILCAVTFALSVILVALNGFRGHWWVYVFRFLILFSSIIPISCVALSLSHSLSSPPPRSSDAESRRRRLRVNLDMGKTVYAHQIMHDPEIPETIVRTSTLPEELGRIEYLLSDKTGTLTQNEMELKKLHLGTMSFGVDSMDEVAHQLATALGEEKTVGAWRVSRCLSAVWGCS